MTILRGLGTLVMAAGLAVGVTGCLKKVLLNGQIKGTRDGSAAVNTLHDFEVARAVAQAGLGQLEGMHKLAPENTDALFLLARGWGGATFGFTEDDWEAAYEKEAEVESAYHLARTRAGWARAVHYGVELLGHHAEGFEAARRNQETIRKWMVDNFSDPEKAEELLWIGYAWVGNVGANKDIPEVVGELHVGVEIVRRSVELDETAVYATGHTILGAYHARTAMAELDLSKQHFDKAIALNGGKFLPTRLNLATRYYCAKSDRPNWEKTLNEVLAAGDDLPEARLQNVISKRRARRYLGHEIWTEECGFGA